MFVDSVSKNIIIKFHRTDILEFTPDNKLIISLNGWTSVTTMQRARQWLPDGVYLSSKHVYTNKQHYPYDSNMDITIDLKTKKLVKGDNNGIEEALIDQFTDLMHAKFSPRKRVTDKLLASIAETKKQFREIRGESKVDVFNIVYCARNLIKNDESYLAKVKEFKQKFHNKATKDYFLKYAEGKVYKLDNGNLGTSSECITRFDMSQKVNAKATKTMLAMLSVQDMLVERFNNEYKGRTVFFKGQAYSLSLVNISSIFSLNAVGLDISNRWHTACKMGLYQFFHALYMGEITTLDIYNALTEV
jgi:hypothetical protein